MFFHTASLPHLHVWLVLIALLAIDKSTTWAEDAKQEKNLVTVEVTIDPDTVVRTNGRLFTGVNHRYPDKGGNIHDGTAIEAPAWEALKEAAPGLIRFPSGNWCYGYHFNLAIDGIAHRTNCSDKTDSSPNQDFRPQHFLKMINALNDEVGHTTPMIHVGAQHTTPEEAAAFVAFMIGKTSDTSPLGTDSLGRKINLPGFSSTSWGTVQYWANKREATAGAGSRYSDTLFFQFGNEEWIKSCTNGNCGTLSQVVDMKDPPVYGGIPQNVRSMSITDVTHERSGQYAPRFVEVFKKIRALWPSSDDVAIGGLAYSAVEKPGSSEDRSARTRDGWNKELYKYLNEHGVVPDYLTIHTYMYDTRGWDQGSASEKRHNLLASDSHVDNRIAQIKKLAPTQALRDVPFHITEWNTFLTPKRECTSQVNCDREPNLWPSTLLQALHIVNWVSAGMYSDDLGGLAYFQLVKNKKWLNKNGGGTVLLASSRKSTKIFKPTPFYAYKLLGMMHNTVVARTNPTNVDWKPWCDEWDKKPYASSYWKVEELSYVTAAATVSGDRKEMAVLLLNKNTVDSYRVRLNLGSFDPDEVYTKYVLNSNTLDEGHEDIFDRNLYPFRDIREKTEVEVLETSHSSGAAQDMTVNIPSHSATLLKFTR